ncbi:hypothetical protein EIP91_007142 [Steccherinum ochraceum]|uniref:XPG-I domain-containing protein n=1 Tax=Steccherinum ochraceum TaxID=92696 RepID=A0A4R0R732_9APHY|nr:hypothetical protein EIP91_007142 [Steccherinum ochraceum]
MGVAGLWDVLRPAGQVRSLTHLSVVDGFEKNTNGHRGFRLGIDASIWFYHAAYGREGENPELRTLFFRCTRLMKMPFLPLFVFDGDERPGEKRGKRISGKDHWMVQGMQSIIQAFGFEWHMAPGEAEAELAYLNRIGVIDGILSDDVDNFLFGAELVIRNPSATLSGNRAHALKNSAGKMDDQHVATYSAQDLRSREDIQLTRGGLILIGILRGGDYHQAGLTGCGVTIAHGLAKCGFGDSLYQAALTMDKSGLERFLEEWREDVRQELKTNSKGFLGRKNPSLAKNMPDDFPDVDILMSYVKPITSERKGGFNPARFNWQKEPDLGKIAGICELYFEWGVKEIIVKRFRTVIWPSAVLRILRRAALLVDERSGGGPLTPTKRKLRDIGTPSKMIAKHFSSLQLTSPTEGNNDVDSDDDEGDNLVVKIHSSRTHASTDGLLEYRLEIVPAQLVQLTEAGVRGLRTEILKNPAGSQGDPDEEEMGGDDEEGKAPADPLEHLRVWMPACIVEMAEPTMVEEFKEKEEAKAAKKRAPKGSSRKKAAAPKATPSTAATKPTSSTSRPKRSKSKVAALDSSDEEVDSDQDVLPSLPAEELWRTPPESFELPAIAEVPDPDPLTSRPPKPSKPAAKKDGPSSSQTRSNIDGFFKASKATSTASNAKPPTKASKVASLFENVQLPEASSSKYRQPSKGSSRPTATQRTRSLLDLLDEESPQSMPKRFMSAVPQQAEPALTPRPFPMTFTGKSKPAQAPTSPRRRKSSNETSSTDHDVDTIHKSPRKSRSRDSPRRSSPTHTPTSKTDLRDRSVSPSPMRRQQPAPTARAKATTKPSTYIEISSDSDDALPTLMIPLPKKKPQMPKRTAATSRRPMPEVIDLT